MYRRMMTFMIALAGALLMTQTASGFLTIKTMEEGIESSTLDVRIPSSEHGSLIMRRCADCAPFTIRITAQTRYFIGDQQVSQRDFRRIAGNAARNLVVFYEPESKDVTRIVMNAG